MRVLNKQQAVLGGQLHGLIPFSIGHFGGHNLRENGLLDVPGALVIHKAHVHKAQRSFHVRILRLQPMQP